MFVSVSSSIIYYIFVKEFQNESKNPHAKREVKLPTRRAIPLLPNRRTKEGLWVTRNLQQDLVVGQTPSAVREE